MQKYTVKILEIQTVSMGTKTYVLEKPQGLTWEEGRHMHVAHIGFDQGEKPNKTLVRHMSISSLPEEGTIHMTTRIPGSGSEFKKKLSELKVGDQVVLFKIGSRLALRREERPLVFLSMGVGIATVRPIIKRYVENSEGVKRIVSINVDRTGDHAFKQEISDLNADALEHYWVRSRSEYYLTLDSISVDAPIYSVVGSDAFITNTIKALLEKGVSLDDILLDKKEEKRQELLEALKS